MEFDKCVSLIRIFFKVKGFIEVYPQTLSILEMKEPFEDKVIMNTSKIGLETEMLNHPYTGYFCISYTYRDKKIFPMFEFIMKGLEILPLQHELLEFMDINEFIIKDLNKFSFWNMKKEFVYVIRGIETIYCAELLCDPVIMKHNFNECSMLYNIFSKEHVEEELNLFLNHTFIERSSGQIDIINMIRAIRPC